MQWKSGSHTFLYRMADKDWKDLIKVRINICQNKTIFDQDDRMDEAHMDEIRPLDEEMATTENKETAE